jgi:PAS domain S-box-containing protein
VRKDGSLFWANVVITALRDRSGTLVGFAKVTRDLTQRRDHEESLRQSEERFRLLVEGVSDYAIFMLDVNGMVASWNAGAQRIKGYAADEVVGRHFSIFYPADARQSGWPDHELQVAAETGRFAEEGWRVRQDGSSFWASVTLTALRDTSARLIGFAQLTRDLTGQKRAEALEVAEQERVEILEAERSARIEAQRAIRIKDEFLATLSHELRTPLSSILGWTQILMRKADAISPSELKRGIEVIDRNARAQVRLIDDLLDLNRIMAGQGPPRAEAGVARRRRAERRRVGRAGRQGQGHPIETRLAPDLPLLPADYSRLQQVVWNLLSNAIKFTGKGGRIEIELARVGAHGVLSVSDTGIGIAENFLPRVFDRFAQKDATTTRSFGGLGLGLAIAKQLVELHGGTIRAGSPGEGRGATFVVELPLAAERTDAAPVATSPADAAPPSANLPKLDGIHVFVVDDEADGRELLKRVLEDQAATVTALASGAEALTALRRVRPNLIVSDIGMPVMDGYQLMRTLRAREAQGEQIPAVALTAFARDDDRKRALLAGYQAHLSKPFDVAELVLVAADLAGR